MASTSVNSSDLRGVGYRVFLRSFFLETLWNYQKMQNVGFVFSIYPALLKLYPDCDSLRGAVSRNLEPVNTHPSMGPLLVGLTALLEKERECRDDVITYRRALMTTLAAQGDHIFWGVIKPLAAVAGVLTTLMTWNAFSGALVAFLVYNMPNIAFRAYGFGKGWSEGLRVLTFFQSRKLDRTLSLARDATACGLGVIVGVIICLVFASESPRVSLSIQIMEAWGILSIGAVGFFLLYKHAPVGFVIFLAAFGSLFFLVAL